MLERVTSSGFKGAGQGAMAGAFSSDIPTGGFAPKGFKVGKDEHPELAFLGMEEHESDKLSQVVRTNIENADGVLFFHSDEMTKLEENILGMIEEMNVPFRKINIKKPLDKRVIINFITDNKVKTLHVEGKADRHTNKHIYKFVMEYMKRMFKDLLKDYAFGHGV